MCYHYLFFLKFNFIYSLESQSLLFIFFNSKKKLLMGNLLNRRLRLDTAFILKKDVEDVFHDLLETSKRDLTGLKKIGKAPHSPNIDPPFFASNVEL